MIWVGEGCVKNFVCDVFGVYCGVAGCADFFLCGFGTVRNYMSERCIDMKLGDHLIFS